MAAQTESALDGVLAQGWAPAEIAERRRAVRLAVLETAPCVREPQFTQISPRDLAVAFAGYDAHFFGGSLRVVLGERSLTFRMSTRASRRGGSLRVSPARETPAGLRPQSFELTVSATPLFESFRERGRPVTVGGHACADRLDALQRILEHETVHLVEQLRWHETNCSRERFQGIARRVFGHAQHTHQLVTPGERAFDLGLRPGQRVAFDFQGVRQVGILNGVTKRATVLVPHPDGEAMSDGNRYLRFYVPLLSLTPA